jgi:nucleotide-binding universal stress UspA family protein
MTHTPTPAPSVAPDPQESTHSDPPVAMPSETLHDWAATWLDDRGIPREAAEHFGLTSSEDKQGRRFLHTPYRRDGQLVLVKHRQLDPKKFWQDRSSPSLFNIDAIRDDPNAESVVIVEGEMDAIACHAAGWPNAVTLSDGAQRRIDTRPMAVFDDPYVRDVFARMKRIVVAVDDDADGIAYRNVLIERFGEDKTYVVSWPEGTKDANELLMRDGPQALDLALSRARAVDIPGIVDLHPIVESILGHYDGHFERGLSTGWPILDEYWQWFPGMVYAWTGIPSHGKGLHTETPLPTPDGWTTIGELKVGDRLLDEQGNPCAVTYVTEVMHNNPCYLVRFDDGSELVADDVHRWLTWSEKARRSEKTAKKNGRDTVRPVAPRGSDQSHKRTHPSVVSTADIASSLVANGKTNHAIELAKPLQLPDATLPVDPYWLGLWLGDGDSTSATITKPDEEVAEACQREAESRGLKYSRISYEGKCDKHAINNGFIGQSGTNTLLNDLKAIGVLGNKHIPVEYLRASEEQRRSLLSGLLDSDGYAHKDGTVEFSNTNKALVDGVFDLVSGLGFRAMLYEGMAKLNGRDCGPAWRVCFRGHGDLFRIPRKQANVKANPSPRSRWRRIVACDPIPSVPVRCLTVDSPNSLFLAGRAMIPTHNTTFLTNALANAVYQHGWKVGLFSPEMGPHSSVLRKFTQVCANSAIFPGEGVERLSREAIEHSARWVADRVFRVDAIRTDGENVAALTFDELMDRFTRLVVSRGINIAVIDPWIRIDAMRPKGFTETEWIANCLNKITRWSQRHQVAFVVVNHPRKQETGKSGEDEGWVSPYEMMGSSYWFALADFILAIKRNKYEQPLNHTFIRTWKVREEGWQGKLGITEFTFDAGSQRFYEVNTPHPIGAGISAYTDLPSHLLPSPNGHRHEVVPQMALTSADPWDAMPF